MTSTEYEPTRPYETLLYRELQDDAFVTGFLNECLQDEEDLSVFLLGLKQVIEARQVKMSDLAKRSGLNRESLYKMLSLKGNPEVRSLKALLESLGLKLQIAS